MMATTKGTSRAPRVGDHVRVTKTTYTRSISVGATGRITVISPHDGVYNIKRDDGAGIGWCEECVVID